MMDRVRTRGAAVAACFVLLTAGPAVADSDDEDHIAARAAMTRGEIMALDELLEIALRAAPGDVIEVDLDREDEGWEYEVKVLTSTGRVREVTLDARSGRVLEIEDD